MVCVLIVCRTMGRVSDMDQRRFEVTFTLSVVVDAESVNEAEDAAWEYWDKVCPDLTIASVVPYTEDW